jgi:N-acyl-L-homoserine lactone synthetase
MFAVTDKTNAIRHAYRLHSFSKLRHEIFIERLKWPLNCPPGREIDQYDDEAAVYITATNPAGHVVAGARLLDTSRLSLLADTFPELVDGPAPRDPAIWDVTRFAVDHRKERTEDCGNLCAALVCALQEHGLAQSLDHYVSVSDVRMEPILRRAGCRMERMGPTIQMDGTGVVALHIEISHRVLENARRRANITGHLLYPDDYGILRRAA